PEAGAIRVEIIDSLFSNNTVGDDDSGGAISFKAASAVLDVQRSQFLGNSAKGGGAVCVTGAEEVFFNQSRLEDNKADRGGSLLFETQGQPINISISSTTFARNSAGVLGGGAILALGQGSVLRKVENTTFVGNSAAASGGAVELDKGVSASFKDAFFDGNAAAAFGGGIAALEGAFASSLDFENTTFSNNRADEGGAVYLMGEKLNTSVVGGTRFVDNFALEFGGAIASMEDGDLRADGVSFVGNQGTSIQAVARFKNANFSENRALAAGALFADGLRLSVELGPNVSFLDNSAMGGGLQFGGGAVNLRSVGEVLVRNVTFELNRAEQAPGAAMLVEAHEVLSKVILTESSFSRNSVRGTRLFANGGALNLVGKGITANMTKCVFRSNAVDMSGGGVAANGVAFLHMDSIVVANNSAGNTGGGMYVQAFSNEPSVLVLTNLTFDLNSAGGRSAQEISKSCSRGSSETGSGGGLALFGENVACTINGSSTFRRNSALNGGALDLERTGEVTLQDTEFVGNAAILGGAMRMILSHAAEKTFGDRLKFVENSACDGAAVCVDGDRLGPSDAPRNVTSFRNVLFEKNVVENGGMGGGGVSLRNADMRCQSCTFSENVCKGALPGDGLGGAALVTSGAALRSLESRFEGNVAREGGAVYCAGRFVGNGTDFTGNVARENGGGLRIGRSPDEAEPQVELIGCRVS
ncbi:unnamed protein product, partial [Ostreobium quekettii]